VIPTVDRFNEETLGSEIVGYVISGLALADIASVFVHYAIRGSPSLCQHIWIAAFALLELPILVLTLVWAPGAVDPSLIAVSAFFTITTVSWRVGSFARKTYVCRRDGFSIDTKEEGVGAHEEAEGGAEWLGMEPSQDKGYSVVPAPGASQPAFQHPLPLPPAHTHHDAVM